MSTKKRRVEYISFYNHTGLEEHFTTMAKKGWLIESISNFYWTYRKIEPKDLHFCVTYYPRASDFDPGPSEEQQTFHDFCAHTGWQLTCTWHQMQVFYNEKENPIPLETDPVLEVETLHKACKKNFLPSYFLLLALGLLMGCYFVARIFADPIGLLSDPSHLMTGTAYVCMAIISITELLSYFLWYGKAKREAQNGVFVDTPSTAAFQKLIVLIVAAAFAAWVVNILLSGNTLLKWIVFLMLGYMVAIFAIVNGIKQGLKKLKASRGLNRALTFAACFILPFVMTALIVNITLSATRSGVLDADFKEHVPPLNLSDLIDANNEDGLTENRFHETILLGYRVVHQRDSKFSLEGTSSAPDLKYTIVTVKAPFLYDWCKEQMYYEQDETYSDWPVGNRMIYKEQDPAPWGANEVYRLYSEEGWWTYTYLLCYEDQIIEIRFDWEPTAEQMAIVSQKLNS